MKRYKRAYSDLRELCKGGKIYRFTASHLPTVGRTERRSEEEPHSNDKPDKGTCTSVRGEE